ncbi:GNAT family N-acetyltransferase [Psychromonas sp. Urea-02u-13]|uniref:GNAT family N-acetyltransferase n=1 Tax=Psychromonas sp. Urea-02u-13 TaxID=2058326 RepID=UPI000C323ECF|nr:GNAT family N-acetyltransferase [Psychromonas sp. Urea-02u-13]PKG39171.1 GNAT family N-acetyltransferase [Psychromonas sp. Urea-02u-13]
MIKISTERLTLRPFQSSDFYALHQLLSDPVVMRFSLNGPYSETKSRDFMNQCIQKSETNQPSLLAVINNKTNQLIGSCGFFPQKILGKEELEVGYRLLEEFWGQGLATEAALALQNYARDKMGRNRLISLIEKENIASVRVAEKNGYKLEKEMLYDGRIKVCIYALTL